ncbi:ferritin-like domain-containing protein [Leptolyngbya sp. 7M]|uniref:ferritin-like domain-containing protein n=1 Tax=Leptolyngbya sp. 7M TaxID=2812896 RepID=UPI001B8B2C3F|nr:ferritin-like domain-containing protein [Leptolyngbya sp. 7M]QYO67765.1 acyl-ACP desaturase [Leptolyngbya sp. 7M]
MIFETKQEVLAWYDRQERSLTDEFIGNIEWDEVRRYPFDDRLIPVLLYMRDVETLTDMYWQELRRTPTGRDPVISKFMERWGIEEVTHGEVLNQFLNELGYKTGRDWKTQIRRNVSKIYHINTYLLTSLTNLIGHRFTATHMTFGAVHEMTTAQAYRRMIEIADHPVLTKILKGIIREESAHTQFYWSVARLEMRKNDIAQKLARKVVENFYYPVGQGSLAKSRTKHVVSILFGADEALASLDKTVTQRIQQLPGFEGVTKVTEKIGEVAGSKMPAPEC